MDCNGAQRLMSPFIDSMATDEEGSHLEAHLELCEPCRRQLQSFISVRSLLARMEQPAPPVDLVLESRVKLSQVRHSNYARQLEHRIAVLLKPLVVPAFFGVSLTALFFALLFGSLVSPATVLANNGLISRAIVPVKPSVRWENKDLGRIDPTVGSYKPVRTSDPTMKSLRFAVVDTRGLEEPLTIEVHVSGDGRVMDYEITDGAQTPEIDSMLKELLYYAQFSPATALGKPVASKVILSFVDVRS